MFLQNQYSLLKMLASLIIVIIISGWIPKGQFKQDICEAEALFKASKQSFKTYSVNDYIILVDITESIDKNGPPTTFKWETGDGKFEVGPKFEHKYRKSGKYRLTLFATSTVNLVQIVDTSFYEVEIGNFAIITPKPQGFLQYYFDAKDTELGNSFEKSTYTYYWDFGDGEFECSSQSAIAHQFENKGQYTIRLIVKAINDQGKEKKIYSKKTITVTR